jgi:hypothetical protein
MLKTLCTASIWLIVALLPAAALAAEKTDTFVLEVDGMV